jgi:hypothetical protein
VAAYLQPVDQLARAARGHAQLGSQVVDAADIAAGDHGHRLEQGQRKAELAPEPQVHRRREPGGESLELTEQGAVVGHASPSRRLDDGTSR